MGGKRTLVIVDFGFAVAEQRIKTAGMGPSVMRMYVMTVIICGILIAFQYKPAITIPAMLLGFTAFLWWRDRKAAKAEREAPPSDLN